MFRVGLSKTMRPVLWIGLIVSALIAGCVAPTASMTGGAVTGTTTEAESIPELVSVELAGEPLRVVASTNIVGDIVAQIGGEHIQLTTLMPPGVDPHGYQLTPADRRLLDDAHVVFVNGLGLEEGLLPTLAALTTPVISVNSDVRTLSFDPLMADATHEHEHEHADEVDEHDTADVTSITRRLFVADATANTVQVIDLPQGEPSVTLPLDGAARLYVAEDVRHIYAVQTDADQVAVIDGGLWVEDHGDHVHNEVKAAELLPTTFAGARPIHFVMDHDQAVIFFDDDGMGMVVDTADMAALAAVATIDSGRPHHGVGVPLGDHILLSLPEAETEARLPYGVGLYTLDGTLRQEIGGCPGLHGEAPLGDWIAFGCSDGVLLVDTSNIASGEPLSSVKLDKPVENEDQRTGALIADPALPYWIGNLGSETLIRIDIDSQATTLLPLPGPYAGFALDTAAADAPGQLVVLTMDGTLRLLDPFSGDEYGALEVVTPIPADAPSGTPQPGLVVDRGLAYVSDPAAARVRVVDLATLSVVTEVSVAGLPSRLAVLGFDMPYVVPSSDSDHDDESDHEHADHEHAEHTHTHTGADPHTWMSVPRVAQWTQTIGTVLAELDPAHATDYARAAAVYRAELADLDVELHELVATVPPAHRLLVTDHDSFGYFAAEYGFDVVGAVIPSFSTLASPSAQDLAQLQEQIDALSVPAILVGSTVEPGIAAQLAEDLSIQVVPIYTGSLSEADGPAPTYLDFMRHNTRMIVEALR